MQCNGNKPLHCESAGSRTEKPATADHHLPFTIFSSFKTSPHHFFLLCPIILIIPVLFDTAVIPVQNTGEMKRGKRNHPLWFMPNNTYFSICSFVCVRLGGCLCIVVNCSDPGIPANSIRQSKIEHGNFTFGTVVFYDCNPGYYLFGSPVLTCQPTGQWDKPLPECIG